MHVNLDPQLVGKIVNEVKSQGVFDQFRKDCMSDVDTKPAYQNLRQRVENTVSKFLSQQRWTPDMNKNQLREKLRKHITEANFLDVGVERIVDQVVNPKISTIFEPKIEDIAYKYLGVEKPNTESLKPKLHPLLHMNGKLEIKTDLMFQDLEQVSPDSDKVTVKSEKKDGDIMETYEKGDDFESPPFELIEGALSPICGIIKDEVDGQEVNNKSTEGNSDFSYISGLTSHSSSNKADESFNKSTADDINISADITQESELSQVSSNSRLSIVTNEVDDTQSRIFAVKDENNVAITEEAQMPKFNENSNSNMETGKISAPLHFDIKKDEIKFEGTDRNAESRSSEDSPVFQNENENKREAIKIEESTNMQPMLDKDSGETFNFSKMNISSETINADSKTLEDSTEKHLKIVESSMNSVESHSVKSVEFTEPYVEESKKDKPSKERSTSHKKHSKDKRSDRSSSSQHKHSSSSNRHDKQHSSRLSSQSSSRSQSGAKDPKDHRSSSSSHKSIRHHSSRDDKSSSSKNRNGERRSRSDRDKDKSINKSKANGSDDHYSSKTKTQRRKSTDSNDGDNSRDMSKINGQVRNSQSGTANSANHSQNGKSTSNTSITTHKSGPTDTESSVQNAMPIKPIILDSLLGNPNTQFIRMGHTGVYSVYKSDAVENETGLLYFNEVSEVNTQLKYAMSAINEELQRIKISKINGYAEILRKVSASGNESTSSDCCSDEKPCCLSRNKRHIDSLSLCSSDSDVGKTIASATLTIDCIQYNDDDGDGVISKKFKYDCAAGIIKVSPTPSEMSGASKENEFCQKNSTSAAAADIMKNSKKSEKKNSLSLKASQRYTSEDLYKPRPILSQRSRRRGLDAEV